MVYQRLPMELSRARPFCPVVGPHDAKRRHEADALTAAADPRGRFITVQLALAITDPESEAYEVLVDEERWLLARHAEAWAERVGLRPEETSWARGAVERAWLTWSRFRIVGPRMLETARPRTLHLRGPRSDVGFLTRCDGLRCVERLELDHDCRLRRRENRRSGQGCWRLCGNGRRALGRHDRRSDQCCDAARLHESTRSQALSDT